jgi:hypothetical protein
MSGNVIRLPEIVPAFFAKISGRVNPPGCQADKDSLKPGYFTQGPHKRFIANVFNA